VIVLVDAFYEAYRNDATMGHFKTKAGKPTGMVFGVLRVLRSYAKNFKAIPIVVWDGAPTARQAILPSYKSTRSKAKDGFHDQVADLKLILGYLGIPQIRHPGWEADDVMAALAWKGIQREDVTIVTGDHDLLQLVGTYKWYYPLERDPLKHYVQVYTPRTKQKWDKEAVVKKYQAEPKELGVLWALQGDDSDDIPGVPRLGGAGAFKVLKAIGQQGHGKTLYEKAWSVDKLEPVDDFATFNANIKVFRQSLDCLRLRTDILDGSVWDPTIPNFDKVVEKFLAYEFKSFLKPGDNSWKELSKTATSYRAKLI